jgi:hypothetical protein
MWDEKKLELLKAGEWQNAVRFGGEWSGKLRNHGKKFFLQLVAESIHSVTMRDFHMLIKQWSGVD